jgi:hypothetical protein
MQPLRPIPFAAVGAVLLFGTAPLPDPVDPPAEPSGTYGFRVAPLRLQSIGVMQFGPDGTLYVADSSAGAVYAIEVGEALRDTSSTPVRIDDIDMKIGAALGVTKDQLRIHDMTAHPLSQTLYFSVTRGLGDGAVPVIVRAAKRDGAITVLDLDPVRHSRAQLPDAAARDTLIPWVRHPRSITITDLGVGEGELYVAGLSNEGFKSTLRRVPLPFGAAVKSTTVEIYHTSHDRFETASPIESLLPLTLDGRSMVLASYTCSPLAIFDPEALARETHVRGRTVAELGGGNRPLDMVSYRSPRDGKPYILIANSHRTLMRMDPAELASAPALTTPVRQAYQPAGVGYLPVSSSGVLQLDAYNRAHAVVLQRDAIDGSLDVRSQGLNWL